SERLRCIEVVMHDTVRHVLHVPIHRLRPGHLDLVLQVEQVRLDEHASGIEVIDVVSAEAVAIEFWLKGSSGQSPYTVATLRHLLRVCAFQIKQHGLRPGGREVEGDGAVGMDGWTSGTWKLRGCAPGRGVFVGDSGLSLSHGRQKEQRGRKREGSAKEGFH